MNNIFILLLLFLLSFACNKSTTTSDGGFGTGEDTPSQTPNPDLDASDVLAAESSIIGSGSIVANGVSVAVVTITLKAAGSIPVTGVVPLFSATDTGLSNVYGACSSSNSDGVSLCTLASSIPEVKILSLSYPVSLSGGSVTFVNDSVDYSNSSITGDSNILADGSTSAQIRIHLVDVEGNPFSGTPTFRATNTSSGNTYGVCSPLDNLGNSICSMVSTVAETKRLEILSPAYVSGDNIVFISGPADSTQSTILSTSNPSADGVSAALVRINLKDSYGNPVTGITPTFSATDTGSSNVYGSCLPSDVTGLALCNLTSLKAEIKTLNLLTPVAVTGGTVEFIPGSATGANSDIAGTSGILANGTASSTVTITLRDAGQNPIPGEIPTFTATDSGNDNTYGVCSASNASGVSTCTMTSMSPEVKTLRITSPVFDDGGEVTFLSPGITIMVPIDLIDRGLSSNTAATIFDRSLYPLTTTDYVATSNTYYLEIMAININTTINYSVDLLGNGNVGLGSISVPFGTTTPRRFRSGALTIPAGTNNLKIRLSGTAANDQLVVQTAKILIKQVEATKTKLWFPMTGFDHGGQSRVILAPVFQTTATTLATNATYVSKFIRNDSRFVELESAAYRLEGLMSTNNATSVGTMALHNVTDNIAVAGSTVTVTGLAYQWNSAALTNSASFADNKTYEIRFRSDSTSRTNYIFKAGISVRLTNLSQAEVSNRIYMRRSATTTGLLVWGRFLWEEADYSNPQTFAETIGVVTAGGSSFRELDDMGTSDHLNTSPVPVPDSNLSILSTLANYRSSELELTDGNRYCFYDRVNSGTVSNQSSSLIIKTKLR